eukprot:TRINITY_DN1953_c0_g1_i14.p1 TRINITY_DN1953_c0_g1~~TRINITY_DN1953_c0_g1_i14.p1  ORF type:complete len:203 (+),score=61.43 TRINITY_DN1953_c0_g1_i14:297-905(+)
MYDACTDCVITIYYQMYMILRSSTVPVVLMPSGNIEPCAYKFSAGYAQQFPVGLQELADEEINSVGMKMCEDLKYYPLIIKIESTGSNKMTQYTMANFEKGEVKVQKQILQVKDSLYNLEEFYGTEGKKEGNEEESKECVVCYSELANTAVLPCRHLCLCKKCAQIIRMQTSRCPIDRTPVQMFISFKVEGLQNDNTEVVIT